VGTSPRHSRKIALVLNLITGHVSPQFHVVVDDFFETLRASAGNPLPKSDWQKITGFVKSPQHRRTESMNPLAPPRDTEVEQDVEDNILETDPRDTSETTDAQIPPFAVDDNGQSTKVEDQHDTTIRTRSGRVSKPTERLRESIEQQTDGPRDPVCIMGSIP
jgi:hypothetical protein